MANVASPRNGLSATFFHGGHSAYEMQASISDENQPLGRAPSATTSNSYGAANNNRRSPLPITPSRKDDHSSNNVRSMKRINGHAANNSDEDIPENMYLPDQEDPEGWIHRDKLAKIESEELQAAGINLASARSKSRSKLKSGGEFGHEVDKRDEKRQRLQSPAEIEDEVDRAAWDLRLPEEIEEDNAAQMYANPVLRKSGSKIPIMTSSPLPIPAERYERDTPIARKRTASGTMSLESDLNISKARSQNLHKSPDDSDTASSAMASSKPPSPSKPRSKSITLSPNSVPKKTASASRKVSAPPRATPSPSQRPGTRSGEHERPRTATNRPEGDPPWLATMYKPDPRLPPDQQLIPTLAKKQQEARWAEEGAVPKTYDKDFAPIEVHTTKDLKRQSLRNRTPSPVKEDKPEERPSEKNPWTLQPSNSVRSNSGRPGTSGSITGGYSTMPKVTSPPMGSGPTPAITGRSTTMPAPTRMQAQSLAMEDDEKAKKGCGCCVVM